MSVKMSLLREISTKTVTTDDIKDISLTIHDLKQKVEESKERYTQLSKYLYYLI